MSSLTIYGKVELFKLLESANNENIFVSKADSVPIIQQKLLEGK